MDEAPKEGHLLESWKEISSYLNRSERTCRRWEETLALPVHRLDGTPNARVFAYTGELDRWLTEKLHHPDSGTDRDGAATRLRSRRRRLLAAGIVAATALIACAGIIFWPAPPPPIPAVKPGLAVLPFVNQTGDRTLDPWQTALADLIIVDLAQSRYVNVVKITELLRALVALKLDTTFEFSSEDLSRVAAKVGVDHLATGRLVGAGPDRGLVLMVHDLPPKSSRPPREIRARFENEAQAFSTADATSKGIKRALGLTAAHVSRDLDRDVRRISTATPLAFRLFSQGYRLVGIEDYQQGTALLLKAVGEDPEFALAYKYLFRACENSLREEDAKKYATEAFRLSDRMSEREGGELVWLYHDRYTSDESAKLETLKRLGRLYPDDRFGSGLLLGIYAREQNWAAGLPIAERAHRSNENNFLQRMQLAQFYENVGRAADAERLFTAFIDENPNHLSFDLALSLRAYVLIRMGKFESALADLARLNELLPNRPGDLNLQARILLYEGKTEDAEQVIRSAAEAGRTRDQNSPLPGTRDRDMEIDDTRDRIEAHMAWSDLNLLKGRFDQALGKLRRGLEILDPNLKKDRDPLLLIEKIVLHEERAYLLRLTGRLNEALDEIEAAIRACPRPGDDLYIIVMGDMNPGHPPTEIWRLKGLILLELGQKEAFDALVADVQKAARSGKEPGLEPLYHHLLGCRALKDNMPRKAVEYLSRAVDRTSVPGTGDFGPNPAPFFDLARAYDQAEGVGSFRAIEAYEKVTRPSVDRLSAGDLYALSFYHIGKAYDIAYSYRYVRAYEKPEYLERAIANYRKFLGLWGDADPPFAGQVEEARRRLAALEAQVPAGKTRT